MDSPPSAPFFPTQYVVSSFSGKLFRRVIKYKLNPFGRIFSVFAMPTTSKLAAIYLVILILVMAITFVSDIMSSDTYHYGYVPDICDKPACHNDPSLCPNSMICEAVPRRSLQILSAFGNYYITIDICAKLLLCWSVPPRILTPVDELWDRNEERAVMESGRTPSAEKRFGFFSRIAIYLFHITTIVDITSVLPYYLTPNKVSTKFIRIIRFVRMTQVFRIKRQPVYDLLDSTLRRSGPALIICAFIALVILLIVGSVIYIIEMGTYTVNETYPYGAYLTRSIDQTTWVESAFVSAVDGIYWAAITMTTTGYGDLNPRTALGRGFTLAIAFVSLLLISLPVTIIGFFYSEALEAAAEKTIVDDLFPALPKEPTCVESFDNFPGGNDHTEDRSDSGWFSALFGVELGVVSDASDMETALCSGLDKTTRKLDPEIVAKVMDAQAKLRAFALKRGTPAAVSTDMELVRKVAEMEELVRTTLQSLERMKGRYERMAKKAQRRQEEVDKVYEQVDALLRKLQ